MNVAMTRRLNNGVEMPALGLGAWQSRDGDEIADAVRWALEAGYRLVDTAAAYHNEAGVGRGVRESGVPRSEVFVTTKVWNDDMRAHAQRRAFENSLSLLGLDYVDLYLVHWPVPGVFKETWKVLETLYEEKLVRAIGVCNFQPRHLEDLLADARVVPAVNQIEINPWLTQKPLIDFCAGLGIAVEGWRPLGGAGSELLREPVLAELARRHGKSPAQVVIRWNLQCGVIVIPKSVNRERIAQNRDVFDFSLTPDEVAAVDALNRDRRSGPDPDNFSF